MSAIEFPMLGLFSAKFFIAVLLVALLLVAEGLGAPALSFFPHARAPAASGI